jgi:hypothetical protein
MIFLTKLIAMFLIGMGCVLILRQKALKKMLVYVKTGNGFYVLGVVKLVFGTILVAASSLCTRPGILMTLGTISVAAGVISFFIKKKQVVKIVEWWEARPERILHLIGTVQILIGVLIAASI